MSIEIVVRSCNLSDLQGGIGGLMSIEVVVRSCNLSDLHQLRKPTYDTAICV